MTTLEYIPGVEPRETYLNISYKAKSWLLTRDHKRIAILYLISISVFFALGGVLAGLMRMELLTPKADLVTAETYNRLFTAHGVIMVFFFLIPSIPATFGNFFVPLMIGARDLAFPRINLASWYIYIAGAACAVTALVCGGLDTGWTFYPPYSTLYSQSWVSIAVVGIFITGFSSILTGLNFLVTIHKMRCPGMTWMRLPLFIWGMYATSLVMLLGTPVLAITMALAAGDRLLHLGIFDPATGGDPVLFQHLFWFYSHPAVYIMIIPSQGVLSELIATFSRKRVFGYKYVAASSMLIAVIGFLVWGHHLFVSGQSLYAGMVFSFLSFIVAVPTAIKVFNWTATLYQGAIWWKTPLLYAFYFIGMQVIGGMTGVFLAAMGVDIHLTDTYFVVAHFHYVMVGGAVMGYLGALHYWWPKMTGKMYVEWLAQFAAFVIFIGFNLTFFPLFIAGQLGMPRRYAEYPPEFQVMHALSTAGASILAVGMLIPLGYFLYSLFYGEKAGPNPWRATGLEWQTASPPPTENFETTPVVTTEAYHYTDKEPQGV